MMTILLKNGWLISTTLFLISGCSVDQVGSNYSNLVSIDVTDEFSEYWYSGEAEVNTYDLEIMRYGERRSGTAINVFVTEDFSTTKQVKLDNPQEAEEDKVSVLKFNQIYRFETGVYDYSMMNSVFTPINVKQNPHSIKMTSSTQDWCGQAFTQLNWAGNGYDYHQHSYFEMEGERNILVKPELLEDEIMTRIRINPEELEAGEFDLLPGLFYFHLSHDEPKIKAARIRYESNEATIQCIVEYLHLDRTIKIQYESSFPYRILSWTEEKGKKEMVRAVLRESIKSPYWQRNSQAYSFLRDSLQLN